VSYAYNLTGVLDVRPLPAASETVLGDQVTARTDRHLNSHIEQDHRGSGQRHSSTGGLKSFVTAARFCLVCDEIRTISVPRCTAYYP
jgi:putative transposase